MSQCGGKRNPIWRKCITKEIFPEEPEEELTLCQMKSEKKEKNG